MHGVDAGDTLDVYNGDGGDEIEVEGLHDDDVGEVLVDGVDDTGEFEDR